MKNKIVKVLPERFNLAFKADSKLSSNHVRYSLQGGGQPIIRRYKCDTLWLHQPVLLLVNRQCRYPPSNWSSVSSGDKLWLLQVFIDIATLLNPMPLNAKIQIRALFYYVFGTIIINYDWIVEGRNHLNHCNFVTI